MPTCTERGRAPQSYFSPPNSPFRIIDPWDRAGTGRYGWAAFDICIYLGFFGSTTRGRGPSTRYIQQLHIAATLDSPTHARRPIVWATERERLLMGERTIRNYI